MSASKKDDGGKKNTDGRGLERHIKIKVILLIKAPLRKDGKKAWLAILTPPPGVRAKKILG